MEKFQNLILFFKISMGTRKDFFEMYIQFRHPPSKRFTSPELDITLLTTRFIIQKFHVVLT